MALFQHVVLAVVIVRAKGSFLLDKFPWAPEVARLCLALSKSLRKSLCLAAVVARSLRSTLEGPGL